MFPVGVFVCAWKLLSLFVGVDTDLLRMGKKKLAVQREDIRQGTEHSNESAANQKVSRYISVKFGNTCTSKVRTAVDHTFIPKGI